MAPNVTLRHSEMGYPARLTKNLLSKGIQLVTIQVVHLRDMGFFASLRMTKMSY